MQAPSQVAQAQPGAEPASRTEVDSYAVREQKAAPTLKGFQGGDAVVIVGGTTIIVVLVVLVIVLI